MRLDVAAVAAIRALAREHVDAILLKGASFASWLYPDEVRPYGDVDLLVSPDDLARAVAVLATLGYRVRGYPPGSARLGHAVELVHESGIEVDLHRTLFGIGAPFGLAWGTLRREVEDATVAGEAVRILNRRARLLHVALRAAQDGATSRALADLDRAVRLASAPWADVVSLAQPLEALDALNAGLRHLVPAGADLADSLGLSRHVLLELRLQGLGAPMLAAAVRARRQDRPLRVLMGSFVLEPVADPAAPPAARSRRRAVDRVLRPAVLTGRVLRECAVLARYASGGAIRAARRPAWRRGVSRGRSDGGT